MSLDQRSPLQGQEAHISKVWEPWISITNRDVDCHLGGRLRKINQ